MSNIRRIPPASDQPAQPAQPAQPDTKADIKARIALAMTNAMTTQGFAPMTDELDHPLLISDAIRLEAGTIATDLLDGLPSDYDNYAVLAAMAAVFAVVCDTLGADPETAFGQVVDTLLPYARDTAPGHLEAA